MCVCISISSVDVSMTMAMVALDMVYVHALAISVPFACLIKYVCITICRAHIKPCTWCGFCHAITLMCARRNQILHSFLFLPHRVSTFCLLFASFHVVMENEKPTARYMYMRACFAFLLKSWLNLSHDPQNWASYMTTKETKNHKKSSTEDDDNDKLVRTNI